MGKLNVSLEEDVHQDLFKLVPPRKRSEVINEALRKELLHRKRELVAIRLKQLRQRSATLQDREIVEVLQRDRTRTGK